MKNTITFIAVLLCLTTYAQKTVNASDIIRDVKNGKSVTISNATIKGVLDFTFMDEALPKLPKRKSWWNNGGSNTIEKQITNKVSFVNCTFNDDVLAYIPDEKSGYTFIANFEDEVIFKDCTFKQKAMFKYSDFERNTDFSNTKFNNDSTFKYAKFEREISFENTFFDEPATFKYADFKKHVSFANAVFNESAIFKYTEFNNGVSFKNVKFEEDLNIKYAKVSGDFNITNMNVAYDIDSKYTKINGLSFSKYLLKNK
ncbi:pentapeptide repeat-containing protein [Tenacibaculum sp. AHE15PA]|uniref:pentapeptide repeat-containing protein n=1 Tax=unclassified Tenacibaculum TaxID=2635139 RepID=UPI001C4FC269|nr:MULTISPECIES: pentapeptide repeat-containing protein [unclassified Tenacibaculum]QXP74013.1 pentapeptide repeat-containing protein [Tenacibaculum sp. AHE14PA]QXP75619.1 pentapeptide repeat-containing protein [Tenacibaculum sp. AHE15PA]